jgi:hypothetical protein
MVRLYEVANREVVLAVEQPGAPTYDLLNMEHVCED